MDGHVDRAVARPYRVERRRQRADVIEMSVRQHDRFDAGKVDPKPLDIAEQNMRLGTRIEQHGAARSVSPRRDDAGKAMRRTAQATAADQPHPAFEKP